MSFDKTFKSRFISDAVNSFRWSDLVLLRYVTDTFTAHVHTVHLSYQVGLGPFVQRLSITRITPSNTAPSTHCASASTCMPEYSLWKHSWPRPSQQQQQQQRLPVLQQQCYPLMYLVLRAFSAENRIAHRIETRSQ